MAGKKGREFFHLFIDTRRGKVLGERNLPATGKEKNRILIEIAGGWKFCYGRLKGLYVIPAEGDENAGPSDFLARTAGSVFISGCKDKKLTKFLVIKEQEAR